jgi:hypothetical protein
MRVQPIQIDPHFSPKFYAELWGLSESTITRWFQDRPGVLKVGRESKAGRRTRVELRIPFSLAMEVHEQRSK